MITKADFRSIKLEKIDENPYEMHISLNDDEQITHGWKIQTIVICPMPTLPVHKQSKLNENYRTDCELW